MQRKVEVSGRLGSASVFGFHVLGEELNNHATLTIPRIWGLSPPHSRKRWMRAIND